MISRTEQLRTMPLEELLAFTARLSTLYWPSLTQDDFDLIGKFVESDGCTGVPDFYRDCCVIHDWWFRTHRNLDGTSITEARANSNLKQCIQTRSVLGKASLIARLWYWGVRKFGKKAWTSV